MSLVSMEFSFQNEKRTLSEENSSQENDFMQLIVLSLGNYFVEIMIFFILHILCNCSTAQFYIRLKGHSITIENVILNVPCN